MRMHSKLSWRSAWVKDYRTRQTIEEGRELEGFFTNQLKREEKQAREIISLLSDCPYAWLSSSHLIFLISA